MKAFLYLALSFVFLIPDLSFAEDRAHYDLKGYYSYSNQIVDVTYYDYKMLFIYSGSDLGDLKELEAKGYECSRLGTILYTCSIALKLKELPADMQKKASDLYSQLVFDFRKTPDGSESIKSQSDLYIEWVIHQPVLSSTASYSEYNYSINGVGKHSVNMGDPNGNDYYSFLVLDADSLGVYFNDTTSDGHGGRTEYSGVLIFKN